ncbi:MAG: VapC toxin family PIN domain ribonuclease [Deltaproteobacteria bacterium]|nr:MAG: VapC toxin family PIN domain ribonuclease [Deltaproteobacteria bacterium]
MNVVDSCGWLEYFSDGPNAEIFAEPILKTSTLIVPTLSMYEVFKVALRERGEDAALQAIAIMKQGKEIELNSNLAIQAAKTSFDLKIPMADAIILTTARYYQALLWTQDDDFADINGVKYFQKP